MENRNTSLVKLSAVIANKASRNFPLLDICSQQSIDLINSYVVTSVFGLEKLAQPYRQESLIHWLGGVPAIVKASDDVDSNVDTCQSHNNLYIQKKCCYTHISLDLIKVFYSTR